MRLCAAAIVTLMLSLPAASHAADPVIGAIYGTAGPGANARDAIETALEIINGTHAPLPC